MATSYLSPGVYVEEVDRGSKPIEAVGTNTVGFLGESMMGPLNQSVLITNWTQFTQTFGGFIPDSYLAHAVYGYFANGGGSSYVVRVGGGGNGAGPEPVAQLKHAYGFGVSQSGRFLRTMMYYGFNRDERERKNR